MNTVGKVLKVVAVTLFFAWTIVPIVFMVTASLKVTGDIFILPSPGDWLGIFKLLFYFKPSLVQYYHIFFQGLFLTNLVNSILATIFSVLISVPLGLLAAYALSRANIPGKKHLLFWVISTRMAPPIAVIIPLYVLWSRLGILMTLPGLVLAYTTFNLPFSIWLLKGFMDSIPVELEEAARVDGRGRVRTFTDVTLPLIAPGLGATVILCSLMAWNDYIFALILGGRGVKTLPVGITELESAAFVLWGQIMAGGVILIVPMIILGLLIRKYLVQGLTMGVLK
jgi:multiple sugar transport system permease protein